MQGNGDTNHSIHIINSVVLLIYLRIYVYHKTGIKFEIYIFFIHLY